VQLLLHQKKKTKKSTIKRAGIISSKTTTKEHPHSFLIVAFYLPFYAEKDLILSFFMEKNTKHFSF
jgi:hypothetical protein